MSSNTMGEQPGINGEVLKTIVYAAVQEGFNKRRNVDPDILRELSDLVKNLAVTNERLGHMADLVEEHDAILRGNDKNLSTRVRDLEHDMADLKEANLAERVTAIENVSITLGKRIDNILKPIWVALAAFISGAVMWVIELIKR